MGMGMGWLAGWRGVAVAGRDLPLMKPWRTLRRKVWWSGCSRMTRSTSAAASGVMLPSSVSANQSVCACVSEGRSRALNCVKVTHVPTIPSRIFSERVERDNRWISQKKT